MNYLCTQQPEHQMHIQEFRPPANKYKIFGVKCNKITYTTDLGDPICQVLVNNADTNNKICITSHCKVTVNGSFFFFVFSAICKTSVKTELGKKKTELDICLGKLKCCIKVHGCLNIRQKVLNKELLKVSESKWF